MTRSLADGVLEESTVNHGATAFGHCSGPPARLPKFVHHPELEDPCAYERFFIEPNLYHSPAERELQRFKQMHFCKHRIKALLVQNGSDAAGQSDYERFTQLHQQLRDDIASDNLGLVYSLYKRSRIVHVDGDELLSGGMMALARAVDTFNPWLGFRFSTYACNAILRAFYRCALQESNRRRREPVNFESRMEKSDWSDTCRTEGSNLYVERLLKILAGDRVGLSWIEKHVVVQHFQLGPTAQRRTLADIGLEMNLSKERVRQIERRALMKLRAAMEHDPVLNPKPPTVPSGFARVFPENTMHNEDGM